MKVYLVYFNNGEEWEDNFEYVDGVYDSYEKAVKAIEDEGFVLNPKLRFHNEQIWTRDNIECSDEDDEDYFEYCVATEEMFIQEWEVK